MGCIPLDLTDNGIDPDSRITVNNEVYMIRHYFQFKNFIAVFDLFFQYQLFQPYVDSIYQYRPTIFRAKYDMILTRVNNTIIGMILLSWLLYLHIYPSFVRINRYILTYVVDIRKYETLLFVQFVRTQRVPEAHGRAPRPPLLGGTGLR